MSEQTKSTVINDTTDDKSPLFSKWRSWYILVIVTNVVVMTLVYLFFESI